MTVERGDYMGIPLISVIVPVYNVEAYLDRCVQSIVDQSYKNLEIILVDDGSPDNCPALCDAWAAKDSRIKVIHQENAGGGAARNVALDVALGEFVSFVDSDDYISPTMYQHLFSLFGKDTDIVECEYLDVHRDYALFGNEKSKFFIYTTQEAMSEHIRDHFFRQIIWNKLYRRDVIGDTRFPVGKRIDDEFWTYRVIANARKLVHTSCKMYAYRQQPGSVMHLAFSMQRLQAVDAKCQRLELLQKRFPELVSLARINLWYTCLYMGQMSLLHMDKDQQAEAFEKLYSVMRLYPLTSKDKSSLPLKQQVWLLLSEISFPVACKLRNSLKICI